MTEYYIEHQKILVSVDCIVFGFEANKLKVLLGHRKMEPGRGEWSLYGGFVRNDESVDDAAVRTLYELTGMRNVYMQQVGAFGSVDRDPGARVVSVAYLALINVKDYDVKLLQEHDLEWVNINDIPAMFSDHKDMLTMARRQIRSKMKTEPIGFQLLPNLFTLTQLQRLYEAVNDEEIDKRNFRKRLKEMTFIEKTGLIDKTTSKRGALLYRFNNKVYSEAPIFKL